MLILENDLIIKCRIAEVLSQLKAKPSGHPLPISTKFGTFYSLPKDGISFSTTLFSWESWCRENVRNVVECPNYLVARILYSKILSLETNLCYLHSFTLPRVSEELRDWQNVFAIPRFRFFEVFFIYFTVTGLTKTFVIPRTSLYRGSTVHIPTPPPSHLHLFEHLYPQYQYWCIF